MESIKKCQGLVDCWTRQALRAILMHTTSKNVNCGDESFQLVVLRAQLECDRHFHDVETWWTLNDVITFTVRTHHQASECRGRFLLTLDSTLREFIRLAYCIRKSFSYRMLNLNKEYFKFHLDGLLSSCPLDCLRILHSANCVINATWCRRCQYYIREEDSWFPPSQ